MRLFIAAIFFGLCSTFAVVPGVASAQTMDVVGPHNPYCGVWQAGVWSPNGNCVQETTVTTTTTSNQPVAEAPAPRPGRVMQRLRGTIMGVNGHMVTIQQSDRSLVVNDSPALGRMDSGRVAVGRQVEAHGYWEDGTFFATRFE